MKFENSQTAPILATYFQWLLGAGIAILIVRIVYTVFVETHNFEENVNIGTVITKVNRKIKAAVILTIIEFLVAFLKSYLFQGGWV